MGALFGRVVRVEVGQPGAVGRSWEGLRVGFSVRRTLKRAPNKAEITIYGLSRDSSRACQEPGAIVRLLAGYGGAPALLFTGGIERAIRQVVGVEAETKIEATDGGREFRSGWVSKTFAAGTDTTQILRELAAAGGFSLGQVSTLPTVRITSGLTLCGPVRSALDVLARTVGAEWSLQDGELQLLTATGTTDEDAVSLSPDSGLVGSPTQTKDGIELVALLQPTIRPGRRFRLESREHRGIYRAGDVEHTGDSGWETDFYTRITATPV
jgi:hypothetical protein